VLTQDEKEFNQAVLYGRDIDVSTIIEYAKRYPMMSNYQVVVIKEAQDISGIDALASYIENPLPSTILVLCHKNKTPDKRKALYKAIQKKGVYLESKRIHLNKTPDWIRDYLKELGYTITNKACMLMTEFVGNNISKITNELGKLIINIPKGTEITDVHIEENIGISKDYNIFELLKSLETKDVFKANKIIFHFASNPKDNPIFAVIPMVFDFFAKALIYTENSTVSSAKELASVIGCAPFAVEQYRNAAKYYKRDKLIRIIGYLREYDLKTKGVDSATTDSGELMKELIFKILH
jgi:DNA polymerase III subunit delta